MDEIKSNHYCLKCDTHWYGVLHCKDCGCLSCGYTESAIRWKTPMTQCGVCGLSICGNCMTDVDGNEMCIKCSDDQYRQSAGGRYK